MGSKFATWAFCGFEIFLRSFCSEIKDLVGRLLWLIKACILHQGNRCAMNKEKWKHKLLELSWFFILF